jgi:uncharacterized protein YbcI
MAHHLGRGPTKARTVIGPDLVTVVLQDTLTPSERTLLERGDAEAVTDHRRRLQDAIRHELAAIVEALMDRTVLAVLADHRAELDLATVVFVLEPAD